MLERKELLKLWIHELRNGNYRQAKVFKVADSKISYCAVGVLLHAVARDEDIGIHEHSYGFMVDIGDGDTDPLYEASNIVDALCDRISEHEMTRIVQLNDVNEASFNSIANYIESTML
jgi:hypothetical protein